MSAQSVSNSVSQCRANCRNSASACDLASGNWQKKESTAQALSSETPITYTKNASTTRISRPYSQRRVTPGIRTSRPSGPANTRYPTSTARPASKRREQPLRLARSFVLLDRFGQQGVTAALEHGIESQPEGILHLQSLADVVHRGHCHPRIAAQFDHHVGPLGPQTSHQVFQIVVGPQCRMGRAVQ